MSTTSLAAIGNLSVDVVDEQPPRPGGTVFFSACALDLLEAPAQAALSCAAADRAMAMRKLAGLSLPVRWYESSDTTTFGFRYSRTGRRIMRLEAVGASWGREQALEAVGGAGWVHVGSLLRTDFPRETLAALAGEGRNLLVDGQGLVRLPQRGPLRRDGRIGDILRFVTILKLDHEEAALLGGKADPEKLAQLDVPEVLLTLGPKGAAVIANGRLEAVPPPDVPEDVDSIGAGDTFSAAYLVARAAGAEPVEAARRATEIVGAFLAEK